MTDANGNAAASSGINTTAVAAYEQALKEVYQKLKAQIPALKLQEHFDAMITASSRILGSSTDDLVAHTEATEHKTQSKDHKKPVRVYLDGCFDIMHSGHYNAIRQAKLMGDILVVGVHSDEEIMRNKGPPVMNNEERLAAVRACKWVDEVVFDTPYSPSIELLDKLNCDFCVHGDDTATSADGVDAYAVMKRAGRMKIFKRTEGVSTTDLVGRLLLMTKSHHQSPAVLSVSSPNISPRRVGTSVVPPFSLASSAEAVEHAVRALSPVPQKKEDPKTEYGASATGMSTFLPTAWRISAFSNNRAPKPDDVVVYIDGAFDLFHVGHIETLQKAKALGTFLYVGIHNDQVVNQHKGRNYPIMNLHERVLNVLSCRFVDEVVMGAPWSVTKDLIRVLNISIVASGTVTKMDMDYEGFSPSNDPYSVAREMGIFREITTTNPLSTDDVVRRIIENRMKYENRNKNRGKKEQTYIENRQYVQEI